MDTGRYHTSHHHSPSNGNSARTGGPGTPLPAAQRLQELYRHRTSLETKVEEAERAIRAKQEELSGLLRALRETDLSAAALCAEVETERATRLLFAGVPQQTGRSASPPSTSRSAAVSPDYGRQEGSTGYNAYRQQYSSQSPAPTSRKATIGLELCDALPDTNGLKVVAVKEGGAGDLAGIDIGDTLLQVDGIAVNTRDEFREVMRNCVPGTELVLQVFRVESEQPEVMTVVLQAV